MRQEGSRAQALGPARTACRHCHQLKRLLLRQVPRMRPQRLHPTRPAHNIALGSLSPQPDRSSPDWCRKVHASGFSASSWTSPLWTVSA